ncbi:rRNA maturation RNase YbeY [Paraflavisolibacter sp. H34]|uniref:rRNA maturation RNase YbeY n=1 Tax=Huijunlia imazamoxiresistens TaxID=3127457 RepID=UPI00301AC1DB
MEQSNETVFFHHLYGYFYFPHRGRVKEFVRELASLEGKTIETINYIFCSDAYLLEVNQQYLNHDTFTDIITFELSEKGQPLVSDVYISIDRVKDNAQKFGATFTRELLRVIFHGALHLCGYKDKTEKEEKKMRAKEDYYLEYFRVPRDTVS